MATRFSIESVFSAVDRVTAPLTRMQASVGKFTRSLERGLRSASRKLDGLISSFWRGTKTVAKFGAAIFAAVGAAAVIAINKVSDAADKLAKQSSRLEFPIEELQKWIFVAEQSGVSLSTLDSSLDSFANRLGQLKSGTGQLITGLKNNNKELLKQLVVTDDVADAFELYISAIAGASSASEKAALAYFAFGKSGLALVNIANTGTDAIRKLMMQQVENGIITQEQAKIAEEYNDAMGSLKGMLAGVIQQVFLPILPILSKLAISFRALLLENKALIQLKVSEFFTKLLAKLEELLVKFSDLSAMDEFLTNISDISSSILTFTKFFIANAKAIGIGIAAILAISLALKVFIGLLVIVNLLTAANSIVLLVIAFAALVGGVVAAIMWLKKLWTSFSTSGNTGVKWVDATILGFGKLIRNIKLGIRWVKKLGEAFKSFGGLFIFDKIEKIKGIFSTQEQSAGVASQPNALPQIISPQERISTRITDNTTTTISQSELTIRDDTGRAEVTGAALPAGMTLQSSGSF